LIERTRHEWPDPFAPSPPRQQELHRYYESVRLRTRIGTQSPRFRP